MRKSMCAAAALLLAACGSQDEGGKSEAGEAGKAAAGEAAGSGGVSFEPGLWETTVQVVSMNMPNMPAGMSAPMPPPTTTTYCMTPEQAARPSADMLTGSGASGGCTYENFSMTNGRLQGAVQCSQEGASMRSTMDGRFSANDYEIDTQVQTDTGGVTTRMEARTTGRRIGDCPA